MERGNKDTVLIKLIEELILLNDLNSLKEIRESITKYLPIELIHIEDRIACERIDSYLKSL